MLQKERRTSDRIEQLFRPVGVTLRTGRAETKLHFVRRERRDEHHSR